VLVPAATPATNPVEELIVALAVLLLVHVPPLIAWPRAVVPPGHTFNVPVIEASVALTVISVTA
jgi:hypothetical protein